MNVLDQIENSTKFMKTHGKGIDFHEEYLEKKINRISATIIVVVCKRENL